MDSHLSKIVPPKSWNSSQHFIDVINDSWYKTILDLNNVIQYSTSEFYNKKGFHFFPAPITTNSISSPMGLGSDSLPVKVEIGGIPTYLADSMQFLLEYGCRFNEKGCYYLMPSFRGEDADASHLCQFYHSEAELHGGLEDVIPFVEDYMKFLTKNILAKLSDSIQNIAGKTSHLEQLAGLDSFPRISMAEVIVLFKDKPDLLVYDEADFYSLTRKGEQALIKQYNSPVWVTHFEHIGVPFYQAYSKDQKFSQSADLLMGIGETVGAGERHQTKEEVLFALNHHEVSPKEYDWYLTIKEKYPMKTSGFGLGIERYLLWLLNHDDIRDCQLIPRFNGQLNIP